MQNKRRLARTRSPHFLIQTHRFPLLKPLRLALSEISLHWELGLRQI